jgi:histidinol-phosphate aminotransferase
MSTLNDRIDRLIRPELRALRPYQVPEAGDLIKLDAMESPYPWPDWLVDAWLERLRGASLNRYPDPAAESLKIRMRAALGIPQGCAVVLGNGSDELIQMIIQAVAVPGQCIMAPEPTFVMYRQIATVCGLEWAGVALRDDFALDAGRMLEAIERHRPAVVFLAWPNNPTGNLFDRKAVEAIIAHAPGLVVVDEAYAPFTDESLLPAVPAHDNLLLLRTLSKMGFAGLRLGLLAGAPQWLAEIEKTRLPYNISTIDQLSGAFALEHYAVFAQQADELRRHRAGLSAGLQAVPGLQVYPSEANFILFRTPPGQAPAVYAGLKSRGVLIKNLDGSAAALHDCLRVTVGTPDENTAFLEALRGVLPPAGKT